MSASVSVSALQKLVDAGQIKPEEIAAKVKSGEIELHDDRGEAPATVAAPSTTEGDIAGMAANAVAKASPLGEAGLGAAKGGIRTLYTVGKALGLVDEHPELEKFLESQSPMETAGKGIESAAELAGGEAAIKAPLALAAKIPKVAQAGADLVAAAPKLAKVLGYAGEGAVRGAAGYGVARAEGASPSEAATSGVVNATVPMIFDAIGAGSKWLGSKLMNAKVRIGVADKANGADVKTIFDEGLNGLSIRDMLEKTGDKIAELGQGAQSLRGEGNSALVVDMNDVIDRAEKKLLTDRRFIGKYDAIKQMLDNYRSDFGKLDPNLAFPVEAANELKTGVGYNGSWEYGKIPRRASADEIASSGLYSEMRKEIEDLTPNDDALRETNQRLGKLLGLQRALIKRIPVEDRQNPIGLFKGLAIATHNPALLALDVAQHAAPAATAAYRTGQAVSAVAPVSGNVAAGMGSARRRLRGTQ